MAPLRALLAEAVARGSPFLVHAGDIKSSRAPCTDEHLAAIAALLREQSVPVVYSPGDNEWTDCHRSAAGGLDPRARLARVREVLFGEPAVLRLAELKPLRAPPGFPELYAFVRDGVLIVALHVVGSNNGLDPADPAAVAEFQGREAANRRFLLGVLAGPLGEGARALVLVVHADPLFESGRGPAGFRGFKTLLIELMGIFPGPVLVLHGDTHRFRHDRPLIDPVRGVPFERLIRVEVPGSPTVGGVWIEADAAAPEPFAAEPVYSVSLDGLARP